MVRVAEDCLPPNRYAVLAHLRMCYLSNTSAQTGDIAKSAGLPESTTKQVLKDLHVLGLVDEDTRKLRGYVEATNWRLADDWGNRLIVPWAIADSTA